MATFALFVIVLKNSKLQSSTRVRNICVFKSFQSGSHILKVCVDKVGFGRIGLDARCNRNKIVQSKLILNHMRMKRIMVPHQYVIPGNPAPYDIINVSRLTRFENRVGKSYKRDSRQNRSRQI